MNQWGNKGNRGEGGKKQRRGGEKRAMVSARGIVNFHRPPTGTKNEQSPARVRRLIISLFATSLCRGVAKKNGTIQECGFFVAPLLASRTIRFTTRAKPWTSIACRKDNRRVRNVTGWLVRISLVIRSLLRLWRSYEGRRDWWLTSGITPCAPFFREVDGSGGSEEIARCKGAEGDADLYGDTEDSCSSKNWGCRVENVKWEYGSTFW